MKKDYEELSRRADKYQIALEAMLKIDIELAMAIDPKSEAWEILKKKNLICQFIRRG